MTPFYFGAGRRRLFGIYEPSTNPQGATRAALLCNPWGSEYLYAHRSMRQLSGLLAAAGVDCLRFDYFGAGDSAGDGAEGDLVGWTQDIRTAADELLSMAGVNRITIVGLRLGATLAAQASADLKGAISELVLWDPIREGADYIEELYAACRAMPIARKEPAPRPESVGGGYEILGFPLTAKMHDDLRDLSLAAIAPTIPCPVRAMVSGSQAACNQIRDALAHAPSLAIERVETRPAWVEDWPDNYGFVPVKILHKLVEWVR